MLGALLLLTAGCASSRLPPPATVDNTAEALYVPDRLLADTCSYSTLTPRDIGALTSARVTNSHLGPLPVVRRSWDVTPTGGRRLWLVGTTAFAPTSQHPDCQLGAAVALNDDQTATLVGQINCDQRPFCQWGTTGRWVPTAAGTPPPSTPPPAGPSVTDRILDRTLQVLTILAIASIGH
jgi:hypothetical protein